MEDREASPHDEGILQRVKNFFTGVVDDDDHETVSTYSEAVRRGGAVVKVDVDEDREIDMAREALVSAGAVDIEEKAQEWRRSGWSALDDGTSSSQDRAATADGSVAASRSPNRARDSRDSEVIPVVKEELEVGKRTVQAGGVRVFSRMVEEPVREQVELREERARVERHAVDRPASAADLDALKDRTIEVTESVERPVVQKTARVVEEVSVGKDVRQKSATIEDKLRHTEVKVEDLGRDERARAYASFEDRFREDWRSRYASEGGSYDDYAPAYRFGYDLRNDARYQGKRWEDVQAGAERDWAQRYPDSPRQRFKAAVQHAWDSVTD